ncbi:hypothetical protein JCM19238_4653 [Vibrio ponticus]|nr:hypothetical protein JCM19238_4653 [Vibrio ponticus]
MFILPFTTVDIEDANKQSYKKQTFICVEQSKKRANKLG